MKTPKRPGGKTQPSEPVIEKDLCTVFSPEWLEKTARETGLIKRERKVNSTILFWVIVLSFGVRLQRSLASIKRNYEKAADTELSDSSWYDRFTPELVLFLKTCVTHAIEHLANEPNRALSEKLSKFQDVLIQDSTMVRLHKPSPKAAFYLKDIFFYPSACYPYLLSPLIFNRFFSSITFKPALFKKVVIYPSEYNKSPVQVIQWIL